MANRTKQPDHYAKIMALCRSRREEIGLTQAAVANQLNVSKDTYWRWESCSTTPSDGQLKKLLKILEITGEEVGATNHTSDDISSLPQDSKTETESSLIRADPGHMADSSSSVVRTSLAAPQDEPSQANLETPLSSTSPNRRWVQTAFVAFVSLVTGFFLGSSKDVLFRRPSASNDTIAAPPANFMKPGQGSKRPWLIQACFKDYTKELGEATGPVLPTPVSPQGSKGEYQKFVKGTIYLSHNSDKAYAVIGGKALAHEQTGGITGPHALGFPTSTVGSAATSRFHGNTPGTYQRFERGSVYESAWGAYPVVRGMDKKHGLDDGTFGKMGFPIEMPRYLKGKIVQNFEGGNFTVDDAE